MFEMIRRNCRIYLRDRSAVFFSFLSMFILLGLMIGFLGKNNVDSITKMLATFGLDRDPAMDEANALHYVQYWALAGLISVNSVTVSISVAGLMISDHASHRSRWFASTPASGAQLFFSYIIASTLVTICMCTLTMLAGCTFIMLSGGEGITVLQGVQCFGLIVMNALIWSTGACLCGFLIRTDSAWAGLSTVMGTLIGFLGGIYVPPGVLPAAIAKGISVLPFLQSASLMRQVLCSDALETVMKGIPAEAVSAFNETMGTAIVFSEKTLLFPEQLLILGGYGIMFTVIALLLGRHRRFAEC